MWKRFANRREAGRALGAALARGGFADRRDVTVLGLPRGGVPVAFEVARALGAPLDVFVVRKLGVPGEEELAVGAIASGGVRVVNEEVRQALGLSEETIERVAERERAQLERREALFRGGRPALPLVGRVAILVDDGLATGSTMRAAVAAARRRDPARVVVAVPVAPEDVCARLEREADQVVCLEQPPLFWAVGVWYEDFRQTGDEEVRELLAQAGEAPEPGGQPAQA